MIKLETHDLGEVIIEEKDIFSFCAPILGFVDYKRFALIKSPTWGNSLRLLQSIDEKDICFVLVDPDVVPFFNYAPVVPVDIRGALEAGENPMHVFLIAVIPKNFKDATVNLKSPLVFSYESGLAAQVILESDYPIRYPLFKKEGGGDDASSVKKAK